MILPRGQQVGVKWGTNPEVVCERTAGKKHKESSLSVGLRNIWKRPTGCHRNCTQREDFEGVEIPFSLVQFPLWEYLKAVWWRKQGGQLDSWQAAVCGAVAGGIAAFVTTPLDVAKTWIILAKAGTSTANGNISLVLYEVWKSRGIHGLFAGSIPRVTFISMGGFIFLGAYEKVRRTLL
ncbi:S-adenosylmethionine mitochondrial carrier protein-like [Xyrauchen texanus]|uniref:S-adenosylmethionine mitochondrial carrier protein-like n=1 Tax=Xyrauchen texanus TaxID=154827 RepID=UPI002241FC28|nr:S-adenosylmethionine mitochondrial carrier protein-like [Xyrauchen texanus]